MLKAVYFLPSSPHNLHEKQLRSVEVIAVGLTGVWSSSVSAAGRWNTEQIIRCRLQTFHVRMLVKWRAGEESLLCLSIYVNNSTYARFLWEPTLKLWETGHECLTLLERCYKVKSRNGGNESTSAFCQGFIPNQDRFCEFSSSLKPTIQLQITRDQSWAFFNFKSSDKCGGTVFTSLENREVFVCTAVIFNTLKCCTQLYK